MFKYYVLNYDSHKESVYYFNIFQNIEVQKYTEKEVKKYLRHPSEYEYTNRDEKVFRGFEALSANILSIIMWQEWSRREYEISVGDAFEYDVNKLEKWDCYKQCIPNIDAITREVIFQYKQQKRNKNDNI